MNFIIEGVGKLYYCNFPIFYTEYYNFNFVNGVYYNPQNKKIQIDIDGVKPIMVTGETRNIHTLIWIF